jgi:DNA repair ATPase RecN
MKNMNNMAEWHNQAQTVLKKAQMNSEMLSAMGRAHAAFGNESASSLPKAASKRERNTVTRRRLMDELMDLEGKKKQNNANKNRIANLKTALREYTANIENLRGGGCSACSAGAVPPPQPLKL